MKYAALKIVASILVLGLVLVLAGCAHGGIVPAVKRMASRRLRQAATSSGTVPNYVSIKLYVGYNAADGCYGGKPSGQVVESVAYIVETCDSTDPASLCPKQQTPPNGASGCFGEFYISTTLVDCQQTTQTNWYDDSYAGENAFLHSGTPISPSNRLDGSGGSNKCPAPNGGTSGSDYYYWANPSSDISGAAGPVWNWVADFYEKGPIQGRDWVWAYLDNFTMFRPYINGAQSVEFGSLSSWRQALGRFGALMSDMDGTYCDTCIPDGSTPYQSEANALGPGGANFPGNNRTGTSEGVVNEAVDVADLCYGVNTQKTGQLGFDPGYLSVLGSERPWEEPNGTRLLTGGNPRIMINTASQFFEDSPSGPDWTCGYYAHGPNAISILNNADTITLRMVTKAMEFMMTPDVYSGQWTDFGCGGAAMQCVRPYNLNTPIIEWRYTIGTTQGNPTSASQEVAVFPEDELIMVNPVQKIGYFHWSGAGDGGGCAGANLLSADSGGTHDLTLQRSCGAIGTWSDGAYAPVYRREGTCYKLGALLGSCAAAISMANSPADTFVLKESDFTNGSAYHHYLAITGGELSVDPKTGQQICPSSNANCNGAWAEGTLQGSPWTYALPACAPSDNSTKYEDSADCAVILLP